MRWGRGSAVRNGPECQMYPASMLLVPSRQGNPRLSFRKLMLGSSDSNKIKQKGLQVVVKDYVQNSALINLFL